VSGKTRRLIDEHWEAVIDPDDDPDNDITIQVQGAPIANVLGAMNFPCLDAEHDDFDAIRKENEAVARLIAQAPAMYRFLVGELMPFLRMLGNGDRVGGPWLSFRVMVETIVKKIEGKT
jgi:hypothetical protein